LPTLLPEDVVKAMELDTKPTAEYVSLDLLLFDANTDIASTSEVLPTRAKEIIKACESHNMEIKSPKLNT